MELVKKELEVPKEMSEMGDAVLALVKALVVEKKPAQEAIMANVPAILKAIEGFDKVGEEVKNTKALAAFGAVLGAEVAAIFIK